MKVMEGDKPHCQLFAKLLDSLKDEEIYQQALDEGLQKYTIKPFNI